MISHISIKDFAIIEDVQIDFHEGLNLITGETGAGKSIIIEAVSLALGARADTAFVRSGKDKAVVQLAADLDDEEYVITREVSSSGRNLCKINGEIVTLGQVSALCSRIADIHGQYDHQSLLDTEHHIDLVDLYSKDTISPLKAQVAESYAAFRKAASELSSLLSGFAEKQRKKDFMAFELAEIDDADLKPGEDTELENRISLLQNSEKIYTALESAYDISYNSEQSASYALSKVLALIQDISQYSPELKSLDDKISDIYYSLEDVCSDIRSIRDKSEFSPEELDIAISRLDEINRLKMKYGNSIEEIIAYRDNLEKSISEVDNIDELKEKLTAEKKQAEAELQKLSAQLSEARKKAALSLQEKILYELKDLNFKDADMVIDFRQADQYSATGTDIVEFMITTNRGEALKPLAKVASGGEMSRIMLAFKKIVGDYDHIPTMIFDEIDTGISGITASIVGKKMCQIAQSHQIICITHLPQIAACRGHNFKIVKETRDDATFTNVIPLNSEEKAEEIARLLGGINITETTIQSAKELIKASE